MKHMSGFTWLVLIAVSIFCYGCGPEADTSDATDLAPDAGAPPMMEMDPVELQKQMGDTESQPQEVIVAAHEGLTPAKFYASTVVLSGDNTSIEFLGTKPDGDKHAGGFSFVEGRLSYSHEHKLNEVRVRIITTSLWSDDPKLTAHLKSPDFFNVKEHREITFKSTSVTEEGDGKYLVKGDLKMLGVTKEITIPVLAGLTRPGVTLTSEFKVDRTQFGMNYGEGKIDALVGLTVVVGKTGGPPPAEPAGDAAADGKAAAAGDDGGDAK